MMAMSARSATRPPAIERALFALARAQTHPQRHERSAVAQLVYADDKLVNQIVERGVAPVGTTGASGWAAQATQNLVGDFINTLAPLSAAAQIISRGMQIRLGTAASLKLPAREGAPSTAVSWAGEAEPIAVRSYTVNDDCELSPRKFGFLVAISRELAKRASGEAVVRQLIREDAAATLDGAYFNDVAGDTVTHAGMLAGVAALSGYGGGDRIALENDLAEMSDAVSAAGSGELIFVVSPKRAGKIRIKAPDLNRELTFISSLTVADDTIIAIDPLSWAHGFGDQFDLDASEEAVIHMAAPALELVADAGPTTADPQRSAWQTASVALRLLADLAFAARRPNAVAWMTGLTW